MPPLTRDAATGFKADGFPSEFRIVAGTTTDPLGTVVAEFNAEDALMPRIAPLVIATLGSMASWIRIETTRLSTRTFDGRFIFQLSEIFVFSRSKNIALRRPVQTRTNTPDLADSWDSRFLVDGLVPTARYLLFGRGVRRGFHGVIRGCGGKEGRWSYCLEAFPTDSLS